ncbi:MAG: CotS family spore coat protein [Clostridium sp.]|uniref:CotS family spore coat protein n=1 Tax=Clostridium sp. TaxID=1506 RepID=UPI003F3C2D7B
MDKEKIKLNIEREYGIEVKTIEKVKHTYKINGNEGYCLKVSQYKFPHFYFILSSMNHLRDNGFNSVLEILKTKSGKQYVEIDGKYAYLTDWIKSRQSDFNNLEELSLVSNKLSELHKFSCGFNITPVMKPRIYWFSWINTFKTRINEIRDFQNRISQKAYKNDFDILYLSSLEEEIDRGCRSIKGLEKCKYFEIMQEQVMKRGFCHHDFANHNILIDDNEEIKIIDFDYCILDSNIHDLASLMIRSMKGDKWDKSIANVILDSYSKNIILTKDEFEMMKEFMRFPQDFWQIGLQVYWEQQPWGEEFFINKLNRYLNDRDQRERFINNFCYN